MNYELDPTTGEVLRSEQLRDATLPLIPQVALEKKIDNEQGTPTMWDMVAQLKAEGKKPTIEAITRMMAAVRLGELVNLDSLSPDLQNQPGLIALHDSEQIVVPTFQFEEASYDTQQLNPNLAKAWLLSKLLWVDQVKEPVWSTAAKLTNPIPLFGDRPVYEVLMDNQTPQEIITTIYSDIAAEAIRFGGVHGITVVDPRTILSE